MHAITCGNVFVCLQIFYKFFYKGLEDKTPAFAKLNPPRIRYLYSGIGIFMAYGSLIEPPKEVEPNLYLKHI